MFRQWFRGLVVFSFLISLVFLPPRPTALADPDTPECGSPIPAARNRAVLTGQNRELLYMGGGQTIQIINVGDNTVGDSFPIPETLSTGGLGKFVATEEKAFYGSSDSRSFVAVDVATQTSTVISTGSEFAQELRIVDDKLYVSTRAQIRIYDVATNALLGTVATPQELYYVDDSANKVFFKNYNEPNLYILDKTTNAFETARYSLHNNGTIVGDTLYLLRVSGVGYYLSLVDVNTYASAGRIDLPDNTSVPVLHEGYLYMKQGGDILRLDPETNQIDTFSGIFVAGSLQSAGDKLVLNNYFGGQNSEFTFLSVAGGGVTRGRTITLPRGEYSANFTVVDDKIYVGSILNGPRTYVASIPDERLLGPCPTVSTTVRDYPGRAFPSLVISNGFYPNNTLASVSVPGSETTISGSIVNSRFVPDAGQVIPLDADLAPGSGTLDIPGYEGLPVRFQLKEAPDFGTQDGPLKGKSGEALERITFAGTNLDRLGPVFGVRLSLPGVDSSISGTIDDAGAFVPSVGATIPAGVTEGTSTGTLTITYDEQPWSTEIATNFGPEYTLGSVTSELVARRSGGVPSLSLTGADLPPNTPATLTLASGEVILGTINEGVFVPADGAVIPAGELLGTGAATLSTAYGSLTLAQQIGYDPTADTDADGLLDTEEDSNENFAVDPGESDPNNPDSDGDGLLDGSEEAAGSDLDANGTLDRVQGNIASLVDDGSPTQTLLLTQNCLRITRFLKAGGESDTEYDYPVGVVEFNSECAETGEPAIVEVFFYEVPESLDDLVVRRRTPNGWESVREAELTTVIFGGRSARRVRYSVRPETGTTRVTQVVGLARALATPEPTADSPSTEEDSQPETAKTRNQTNRPPTLLRTGGSRFWPSLPGLAMCALGGVLVEAVRRRARKR